MKYLLFLHSFPKLCAGLWGQRRNGIFSFYNIFSSIFLFDFMAYFCLSYSSIIAGICYLLLIILVYKLYSRLYYSVHTFFNLYTYFIALFYLYVFYHLNSQIVCSHFCYNMTYVFLKVTAVWCYIIKTTELVREMGL